MKSKTILSEGMRLILKKNKGGFLAGECFNALVAAEEEIANKDLVIKGYIFNEGQFEKELNDKYKELESRRLIIERLHNENQALIEENAGLKAKNESLKENCSCPPSGRHGWTTVRCCNYCGKSVEPFWKLS